jgi:hypothetical protein
VAHNSRPPHARPHLRNKLSWICGICLSSQLGKAEDVASDYKIVEVLAKHRRPYLKNN